MNLSLSLMWLLYQATGFLVWPLLIKNVASLPTSFRSVHVWSIVENSMEESALGGSSNAEINAKHYRSMSEHLPDNDLSLMQVHQESRNYSNDRSHLSTAIVNHMPLLREVSESLDSASSDTAFARETPELSITPSLTDSAIGFDKSDPYPVSFHMQRSHVTSRHVWNLLLFGSIAICIIFVLVILSTDESLTSGLLGEPDSSIDEEKRRLDERAKEICKEIIISSEWSNQANTKANLLKLEAQNCKGTWVEFYRIADIGDKVAMELLFRCNIIPMDEFAHSKVSQNHIEECLWISTQMLRQRSIEDWVDAWPQATKAFQESITACFAARADAVANLFRDTNSPRSGFVSRTSSPQFPPRSPRNLDVSPPPASDRGLMDAAFPPSPVPPIERMASEASSVTHTLPGTCRSAHMLGVEEQMPISASRLNTGSLPMNPPSRVLEEKEATLYSSSFPETPKAARKMVQHGTVAGTTASSSHTDEFRSSVVARCREIMQQTPTRKFPTVNLPSKARRPEVGDLVKILNTEGTQKWFPQGIGKHFPIRTDDKFSPAAPYQVEGSLAWLQECDLQLVEEPKKAPLPPTSSSPVLRVQGPTCLQLLRPTMPSIPGSGPGSICSADGLQTDSRSGSAKLERVGRGVHDVYLPTQPVAQPMFVRSLVNTKMPPPGTSQSNAMGCGDESP